MTLEELIRSCPELGEWMADVANEFAYLHNLMPYRDRGEESHADVHKPVVNVTYKVNAESTPAFGNLQKQINELKSKKKQEWE